MRGFLKRVVGKGVDLGSPRQVGGLLCFLISFSLLALFAVRLEANNEMVESIFLKVGEERRLTIGKKDAIKINKKGFIEVKDLGNQLVIIGKKPGGIQLNLGRKKYKVMIQEELQAAELSYLKHALSLFPNLRLQLVNDAITITGTAQKAEEWLTLSQMFLKNFSFRAQIEDAEFDKVVADLNKNLEQGGYPKVKVYKNPNPHVRLPSGHKMASGSGFAGLIERYGIEIIEDDSVLGQKPLIRVKVDILEVHKSKLKKLGVKWPAEFSAKLLQPGNSVTGPDLMINSLEHDGVGRVLANPVLVCKSGEMADFFAGGEFPIKTSTGFSSKVEWKKYGVYLKIKPKADSLGHITLSIETELSSINHAQKVDDVPGILANRVNSHFDLLKSQSIMLSGLIKSTDGEAINGLPYLATLPVIGSLFSSRDWQEDKTELVIFVTPEIVGQTL